MRRTCYFRTLHAAINTTRTWRDVEKFKLSSLHDMTFSQRCCSRVTSSGMLRRFDWYAVTDVSEVRAVLLFCVKLFVLGVPPSLKLKVLLQSVFMNFRILTKQTTFISIKTTDSSDCVMKVKLLWGWMNCRHFWKIAKIDYKLRHVCPSVRTEQLGTQWTEFHEIWYLDISQISVEKIKVSLKSDKNNEYFTWRPVYIYDNISLSSS
jgi:hypothetical protein